MYLEEVRQNLLDEAQSSPNLLSDLAGLESYIAESYNNRSFIELLQNADDAKSTKFKIIKNYNFLFVANNGRTFDKNDLESLCRSASSNKVRGETIGYRGIGFKSVVGFAKEVHVLSGDLEITFSREKTKLEIPQASRVPLIRIPHKLSSEEKKTFQSTLHELHSSGLSTVFVFSGVIAQEIELEFDLFDSSSLLFLRNINETEFCTSETIKTKILKKQISDSEAGLTFQSNGTITNWYLSLDKNSSIAFSVKENKIQKLKESDSLVYAFLPTEDSSGLGVLINGDFNTDPSRKHLIFNSRTFETIKSCSDHILKILERALKQSDKSNLDLVNALIPYVDPRMLQFKKVLFEKYLIEELKNSNSDFFKELTLCPSWLNAKDYSILIKQRSTISINSQYYGLEGFMSFAKYLGAKEDTFEDLKNEINSVKISTLGCVQFSLQIFKALISGTIQFDSSISNLNVIISNHERISLNRIKNDGITIDQSFISLLIENGLTEFDIKQILKKYLSANNYENLFPNAPLETDVLSDTTHLESIIDWFNKPQQKSYSPTKGNIKRWRSAEEQTLEIFNLNGFNLEDVSKQNIGYDLEGFDPNGNEIQIEVKSITLPGQKFKLTNNEIAVAQEKQDTYYIAIVRQLDAFIEIALVLNPVNNLTLNRQCVQWIWECSDYEYKPIKFEI